jgi:hypothetical protein
LDQRWLSKAPACLVNLFYNIMFVKINTADSLEKRTTPSKKISVDLKRGFLYNVAPLNKAFGDVAFPPGALRALAGSRQSVSDGGKPGSLKDKMLFYVFCVYNTESEEQMFLYWLDTGSR